MIVDAAKLALSPLLYAQARRVRQTVIELPEPAGEREGVAGLGEIALRILIAGDSSAAGVGARSQNDALARPLAHRLAQQLDGAVRWQLVAQSGLTSQGVLETLRGSRVERADVAIVIVGVNDIVNEVPLSQALAHRAAIVEWLKSQRGVGAIAFPALPEMELFPALPQPLAWLAGRYARRNNHAQARWARSQRGVTHVDMKGVMRAALMAEDGFHPGPGLYARVSERIAEHVLARLTAR